MSSFRIVRLLCLAVFLTALTESILFSQLDTDRAFLGVNTESSEAGGLRVVYVFPASAAEEMGLEIGDTVLLVNDVRVSAPDDLSRELRGENIGAKLRLLVLRDGTRQRINGKIGSYEKTMKTFQERRRKAMVGKPLPPPPSVKWWNGATKSWEDRADALKPVAGHVTIVFSFDNCPTCKTQRLGRFAAMARLLEQSPGTRPVDFRGLFFKERVSPDASLKAAQELFEALPTMFPVGVASYGGGEPTPESRLSQVLLHQHGVAILGPEGNVAYLQIHGLPETEFYDAFKTLFTPAESAESGANASKAGDKDP